MLHTYKDFSLLEGMWSIVYDVDNTLVRGYHPDLVFRLDGFREKGIKAEDFWREVEGIQGFSQGSGMRPGEDIVYLSHFISQIHCGQYPPIGVAHLQEAGTYLEERLYPGLPEFFPRFPVSHHLLSSGIQDILEGSVLAPFMDSITASTFYQNSEGHIEGIRRTCSSREKIAFLVRISRGRFAEEGLDARPSSCYEFPFSQMVYVGDDDRCIFRFLKKHNGKAICVYDQEKAGSYEKAQRFARDVDCVLPADYRKGSALYEKIQDILEGNKRGRLRRWISRILSR